MKIGKRLKYWRYNRLLCKIIYDLHKLRMEDLKEMGDYADALHSSKKDQQEKSVRGVNI